jgi:hypothetical protein
VKKILRTNKKILVANLALILSACGGNGGHTVSQSGYAADGYLSNANVCLDTDSDGSCTGEKSIALTGDEGKFTLDATQDEFDKYSILIEAIAGQTVDSDNPDTPVAKAFTLSSPPGLKDEAGDVVVNPLTTLLDIYTLLPPGEAKELSDQLSKVKSGPIAPYIIERIKRDAFGRACAPETWEDFRKCFTDDYTKTAKIANADPAVLASAKRIQLTAQALTKVFQKTKEQTENDPAAKTKEGKQAIANSTVEKAAKVVEDVNKEIEKNNGDTTKVDTQKIADKNQVVPKEGVNALVASNQLPTTNATVADLTSNTPLYALTLNAVKIAEVTFTDPGNITEVKSFDLSGKPVAATLQSQAESNSRNWQDIFGECVVFADSSVAYQVTTTDAETSATTQTVYFTQSVRDQIIGAVNQTSLVNTNFASKVDFATGSQPYSVTAADMNGDGSIDLAVANRDSNTGSVLLGDGAGSFASKVNFATGALPISVTAADMNGDGTIDLAVTNTGSSTVSVLLNQPQSVSSEPVQCNYPTESEGDSGSGGGTTTPEPTDSDGDGVADSADAFPNDATETADSDSDGVGNNADAFPNDATEIADSDSDGVGDNADPFPNDPNNGAGADSDGDGVPDATDAFPNDATETVDSDSDGVGNNADAFPNDATETADSDSDGVGDNADAFPNDATETADSDSDGVGDNADAFPNDATETVDSDSDGVGDNTDVFPNDPNESVDADFDGVGANTDPNDNDPDVPNGSGGGGSGDADFDGVPDDVDPDPFDPDVPNVGGGGSGSGGFPG